MVTVVPATHVGSTQHTGRCAENAEKTKHFKAVCRSKNGRRGMVHDVEQEAKVENCIEMVNINSMRSYSKQSVTVEN